MDCSPVASTFLKTIWLFLYYTSPSSYAMLRYHILLLTMTYWLWRLDAKISAKKRSLTRTEQESPCWLMQERCMQCQGIELTLGGLWCGVSSTATEAAYRTIRRITKDETAEENAKVWDGTVPKYSEHRGCPSLGCSTTVVQHSAAQYASISSLIQTLNWRFTVCTFDFSRYRHDMTWDDMTWHETT